jgi:hypothetical protein
METIIVFGIKWSPGIHTLNIEDSAPQVRNRGSMYWPGSQIWASAILQSTYVSWLTSVWHAALAMTTIPFLISCKHWISLSEGSQFVTTFLAMAYLTQQRKFTLQFFRGHPIHYHKMYRKWLAFLKYLIQISVWVRLYWPIFKSRGSQPL